MPAYTPPATSAPSSSPTSYDLSRRPEGSSPSTISDATVRVSNRALGQRRVSTVPRAYESRSGRSADSQVTSRREALSRGLRDSASVAGHRDESTERLVNTYTPSRNSDRNRRTGRLTAVEPGRVVADPGASRRTELERRRESRTSERAEAAEAQQNAKRIENARAGKAAKEQRVRRMRNAYEVATRDDPNLRKRMENYSRALNQATDVGLRTALGAGRVPGAGTNTGNGGTHDSGYWHNPYYGCHSWYWNCFFPNYCNWWFGSWSWGWGWGYGYCHSSSYWPYHSPYGYYGYYPAYGYYSPTVIYNYTLAPDPVQVQYVESAPAATPSARADLVTPGVRRSPGPSFGERAASEYMALGDRAFTEGRYGDAVHYYAKSIQFAPQDGVLYLVLSDALFATGDYHYSAFALRRALEFNPELAALGLDKRTFYGQPKDFDEQLAILAKFVQEHPIDRDARLVLAANYIFSLQPEAGVQTLDEAPGGANHNSNASQLLLAAGAGMLAK